MTGMKAAAQRVPVRCRVTPASIMHLPPLRIPLDGARGKSSGMLGMGVADMVVSPVPAPAVVMRDHTQMSPAITGRARL